LCKIKLHTLKFILTLYKLIPYPINQFMIYANSRILKLNWLHLAVSVKKRLKFA